MSEEQKRTLVAVRFRRNWDMYFPNDIAGFAPHIAESLIAKGIALLASDPEETSEDTSEDTADTSEEQA